MKQNQHVILFLFWGFLSTFFTTFVSCQTPEEPNCKNKIVKIEVQNRSFRDQYPQELIITDSNKLAHFCQELVNLHEQEKKFNVQSNLGAYDLIVYKEGDAIDYVSIIFTTYDGVVIQYNDKKYKDDALEWLVLGWLDKAKRR